jgi:hypothetical protein
VMPDPESTTIVVSEQVLKLIGESGMGSSEAGGAVTKTAGSSSSDSPKVAFDTRGRLV